MSVIEFIQRPDKPLFHLEHFIEGDYIKYNSNSGFISCEKMRLTPQVCIFFISPLFLLRKFFPCCAIEFIEYMFAKYNYFSDILYYTKHLNIKKNPTLFNTKCLCSASKSAPPF